MKIYKPRIALVIFYCGGFMLFLTGLVAGYAVLYKEHMLPGNPWAAILFLLLITAWSGIEALGMLRGRVIMGESCIRVIKALSNSMLRFDEIKGYTETRGRIYLNYIKPKDANKPTLQINGQTYTQQTILEIYAWLHANYPNLK